jgi:flagellar biosynthesis/type III secretory pathway chaperone
MPGGPSIKRTTRSTNVILTSSEIEVQASTVNDATSAHLYLKKKSLCHATEPYTINHLISVLLQITQISGSTPLPVLTAIRSVIFLLKQHETDEIAEAVATQVSASVTQNISDSITTKLVDHVIAAIAPQIARILTASKSLEHAAQSIESSKPLSSNPDSDSNSATIAQLTPQILEQITATLTPQLDQLTSTSKSLTNSLEETEQLRKLVENRIDLDRDIDASEDRITHATDTLLCAIEDCQNSIDLVTPSLETTQQRLNTLSLQFLTQSNAPPSPMPEAPRHNLYSNITAPKTHPQTPTYAT